MLHRCTGVEFEDFDPLNNNSVGFKIQQQDGRFLNVTLFGLPTGDAQMLVDALKKLDENRKKREAAKRAREDEPDDERVREALGLPPLYHDDTPSLDTSFHDHEMNV